MEREIAFDHLPTEIWLKILALLDIKSLLAIRQVSRTTVRLANLKDRSDMQGHVSSYARETCMVVLV